MSFGAVRVKQEPEYVLPDHMPIKEEQELTETTLMEIELECPPLELRIKPEPVCDVDAGGSRDVPLCVQEASSSTQEPLCMLQNMVAFEGTKELGDLVAVRIKDEPTLPVCVAEPPGPREQPEFKYEVPVEPPETLGLKPNILIRECSVRLERCRLPFPYINEEIERDIAMRQLSGLLIKPTSKTEFPYYCDICRKGFKQLSLLTIHKQVHSKRSQYKKRVSLSQYHGIADRYISSLVAERKLDSPSSKTSYACEICTAVFPDLDGLRVHALIHANLTIPFKCGFCRKEFASKYALMKHRRTHMEVRPHACWICKATFPRPTELSKHVRLMHSKKKICKACETKQALKLLGNLMLTEIVTDLNTDLCEKCECLEVSK